MADTSKTLTEYYERRKIKMISIYLLIASLLISLIAVCIGNHTGEVNINLFSDKEGD